MNISDVACNSYTWNSQTYTTSGSYTQLFTSMNGCDSLVHLNLTVYHNQTGEMWDYACEPTYTWSLNGETYTTSGDYVDTSSAVPHTAATVSFTLHLLLPNFALSMDISVDSVLCNGDSNGVISVLAKKAFHSVALVRKISKISDYSMQIRIIIDREIMFLHYMRLPIW
jgi:hypothetical protein